MLTSLSVANLIFIALRCCWYRKFLLDYMSTSFQLIIFYGGHICGIFLMTVIRHVCLCIGYLFEILLGYNYAAFLFDTCSCDAYQISALMVVPKSGIKFGWLIYFMVCPKKFVSGRLVNTCSVGCNNYFP